MEEHRYISESEFYLYGEIDQAFGKGSTIYMNSAEYDNLLLSATKQQIKEAEKNAYKSYGVKVSGTKSLADGSIYDLKLKEFIAYKPKFDLRLLERALLKASENLSKINDLDKWIAELKADV